MAITIDWKTSVINIPKSDLTLIQSTPVEIRELNLNYFRLVLKDLEDNPDGMGFLKTHEHFTEVSFGGITLARVIRILDPYTITFGDGQYSVNLAGANSNIGDKINQNQVSIRSANSVGLISNTDIEYASYDNGVALDIASSYSGTTHPVGTKRRPVNNLSDALSILSTNGFDTIYILNDITIDSGYYQNKTFINNNNSISKEITITSNVYIDNCTFQNVAITGEINGYAIYEQCLLEDCSNISGNFKDCIFDGYIEFLDSDDTSISIDGARTQFQNPVNFIINSAQVNLNNLFGMFNIQNKDTNSEFSMYCTYAKVVIENSCTNGVMYINGWGEVIDNSAGSTVINTMLNPIIQRTDRTASDSQAIIISK